jgi:hypothetical protein
MRPATWEDRAAAAAAAASTAVADSFFANSGSSRIGANAGAAAGEVGGAGDGAGRAELRYGDVADRMAQTSARQGSFQTRMTPTAFDEEGWRQRVKYMRDTIMAGEGGRLSDEKLEDFVFYLTTAFGPNSPKPKSPEEMPQYKSLVRPFSLAAMNIAYVEYDFAGANGLGPWSAVEDKDGMMWIPYYGRGNEVVWLNPKTAEMTRFPLPSSETAGIHSVIPAPTVPSGSRKRRWARSAS